MQPASCSTTDNGTPAVWLDELPSDVCNRIASFVLAPRYNVHAIQLSQVSDKQRDAVKNHLAKKFNMWELNGSLRSWCCGKKLVTDFATLLSNDAKEIKTPGYALYTDYMDKCFKSLTLVKASIYDCPRLFYALSYARNVRSLSLKFSRLEDLKALMKRLSVLELRELSLTTVNPSCLHKEFSHNHEDHPKLAQWFPKVQRLRLACYCCGGRDHPKSFLWRVIDQFPALKEVYVPEAVPSDAIDKLRRMRRVSLRAGGVFQLLTQIPEHIVHVDTYDLYRHCLNGIRTFETSHLRQLANCSNLEELQCLMRPGSEYGLARVTGKLRSLNVEFDSFRDDDSDEVRKVYEPEEGVLLEAIKSAPFLKVVVFECVRIKRRELREMLVSLGDRLEEYEERLRRRCGEEIEYTMDTPKRELQELVTTIETAALNNPALRNFHVDGFIDNYDKEDMMVELNRYDAAVGVLERHAPFLNTRQFKLLKERLENNSLPACHAYH